MEGTTGSIVNLCISAQAVESSQLASDVYGQQPCTWLKPASIPSLCLYNWIHQHFNCCNSTSHLTNQLVAFYGKPNGHAQKAVTVQRGKIVGTQNTSVCSENMNSVFFYWLFSSQSYKISQWSYAWVHTDICIVKE